MATSDPTQVCNLRRWSHQQQERARGLCDARVGPQRGGEDRVPNTNATAHSQEAYSTQAHVLPAQSTCVAVAYWYEQGERGVSHTHLPPYALVCLDALRRRKKPC